MGQKSVDVMYMYNIKNTIEVSEKLIFVEKYFIHKIQLHILNKYRKSFTSSPYEVCYPFCY